MKLRTIGMVMLAVLFVFGSSVLADDKCCSTKEGQCCKAEGKACDKECPNAKDGKCTKENCCKKDGKACEAKACDKEAKACDAAQKSCSKEVLVCVNGHDIMKSSVDSIVDAGIEFQNSRMQGQMKPEQIAQTRERMTQMIADMLIVESLLDEKLAAMELKPSEEAFNAKIEEVASQNNMTREQYIDAVKSQMPGALVDMRMRLGMKMETLLDKVTEGKIEKVTEQDAKDYYEENIKQFSEPEKVKASHILVGSREMDDEAKKEARSKAEEVLVKCKEEGADFAALAKEHSTCPSSARGGDLGFFVREQMVPEFSQAAFAMNPGEISDIVETQFGYHIIMVTDKTEASTKTFDDVKGELMENLEKMKKQEFAQKFLEDLRGNATIEWSNKEADAEKSES